MPFDFNAPLPACFDEEYFAKQKVDQMRADGQTVDVPAGSTYKAVVQKFFDDYNAAHQNDAGFVEVTFTTNFNACNAGNGDYEGNASVSFKDINVSPSEYFNIPEYLQSLANLNGDGYTAASELKEIFDTHHSSVWGHFESVWSLPAQEIIDQGYLNVDPSNDFDVSKYVDLRLEAMGPGHTMVDAINAIKESGDPISDWYVYGRNNGITDPSSFDVELPVNPPANFNQWDPDGTLPPDENESEYDRNYVDKEILPDNFEYKGDAGQNTHFVAKYGSNVNDQTLSAKDVITGGEGGALNSLIIDDFGRDWRGFNEVKGETVFDNHDAVNHVGRIVLNHQGGSVADKDLSFNAKNISTDTVQYDIHNVGEGTISLDNLTRAVETINISGIKSPAKGNIKTTELKYESGATTGANKLALGIEDVCTDGNAAGIKFEGIESVTIDSKGEGITNSINLGEAKGITTLTVTGTAGLTIADTAAGIKEFDASAAVQSVTFGVQNLANDAVVKGGAGSNDTVSFTGKASVSKADWTSIESVAFAKGGTVNLKGVDGIENIWLNGDATTTVRNLTADRITIYQTSEKAAAGPSRIDGEINDVNYVTVGGADGKAIKANVESDNTGNVNIEVQNNDTLATGSSFSFDKAEGTITINIANGDEKTDPAVTLDAKAATELVANITGGFTQSGNLASIENVDVTLTNAGSDANSFTLAAMEAAQEVSIAAGGENVTLGALGNNEGDSLTLNIEGANRITLGAIQTGASSDIDATLDAVESITLANITGDLTSSDVTLTATTGIYGNDGDEAGHVQGAGSAVTITGNDLNINFEDVSGNVGASGEELTLKASGAIHYTGTDGFDGNGSDFVKITGVGAGETSDIVLGEGSDTLTIATGATIGADNESTIRVSLGDDDVADTLSVTASTAGNLIVEVHDFVKAAATTGRAGTDDTISFAATAKTVTAVNDALNAMDAGFEIKATDLNASTGAFVYGDDTYAIAVNTVTASGSTPASTSYTMVQLVGVNDLSAFGTGSGSSGSGGTGTTTPNVPDTPAE